MNRRDMIIVAVLMNTGLLAILFMMAMHTDDGGVVPEQPRIREAVATAPPPQETSKPVSVASSTGSVSFTSSPHDELDSAINSYSAGVAPESFFVNEPSIVQAPVSRPAPAPAKPEPVAVVAEEKSKFVDVTVKRGDSLDRIARANNTTINAIRRANDLKTDRLQIGQQLRIPLVAKKEKKSAGSSAPVASTRNAEYYTLKNGDNPWKIAKMLHVRYDDLLKLNNLDEEKARRMKAGDKIRVR